MRRYGVLAAALVAAPLGAQTPRPAAEGRPRWELRWEWPAVGLQQMSLSGDGRGIAVFDKSRVVRRIDPQTGKTLWATPRLDRVDRIAVASGGQVLAWKARSALDSEIWILTAAAGATGARRQKVSGAVWSVAVAPGGTGFSVGTGDRFVTRFPLGGSLEPTLRLGVPGFPESIAIAERKPVSACGLWLWSGVAGLTGTAQWRSEEPDASRWFDLQLSADGSTLLGISQKGSRRHGREARISVWDAPTGLLLWSAALPGESPVARINASGSVIAASYSSPAHYSTGDVMEVKLVLYDRAGRALAPPRGGAYLMPQLVALSASGNRITVLDGDRSLCTLDNRGRTVARYPLAQGDDTVSIRQTQSTSDGNGLLMYRGSGVLQYYQATAE